MTETNEHAASTAQRSIAMPVGVVLQRRPGVTRWVKHAWHPTAVLPGAPPADWKLLRQDGEVLDYRGCDIYEFRGDKILSKDTYWKQVTG